jgi:hypothetical protein
MNGEDKPKKAKKPRISKRVNIKVGTGSQCSSPYNRHNSINKSLKMENPSFQ